MISYMKICVLLILAVISRASELQLVSEVENVLPKSFPSSEDYVQAIQEDIHRPGILLILSNCLLFEVHEDKTFTNLTSSMLPYSVFPRGVEDPGCNSFLQLNTSYILVTSRTCIKQVERLANWSVSTLTGHCTVELSLRHISGYFTSATFGILQDIASVPGVLHKVIVLELFRVRFLLMDKQIVASPFTLEKYNYIQRFQNRYPLERFEKIAILSESEIYIGVKFASKRVDSDTCLYRLNTTSDILYFKKEVKLSTSTNETKLSLNACNMVAIFPLGKETLLLNIVNKKEQAAVYAYNIRTGNSKQLYNYVYRNQKRVVGAVNSTVYLRRNDSGAGSRLDEININNYCMQKAHNGTEEHIYISSEVELINGTSVVCDIDSESWEFGWRETKSSSANMSDSKILPLKDGVVPSMAIIITTIVITAFALCMIILCAVISYIIKKRASTVSQTRQLPVPPVEHTTTSTSEDYDLPFDNLYAHPDKTYSDYSNDPMGMGLSVLSLAASGPSVAEVDPSPSLQTYSETGIYVIDPRVATVVGNTISIQDNAVVRLDNEGVYLYGRPIIYVTNPTEA